MATGQSQTTDTLVLNVCRTAFPVDAQFIVTVNGVQVGGVQTATALYTNGTDVPAPITLTGNFGPGRYRRALLPQRPVEQPSATSTCLSSPPR